MDQFRCKKGNDGLNYVDVFIEIGNQKYKFDALIKTGSDVSIFSAKKLGIDTTKLKKVKALVGWEQIDVYEAYIDSISIGKDYEGHIYGVNFIYVSDLEGIEHTPILGSDYLRNMNISAHFDEGMTLEFAGGEVGEAICAEHRAEYLRNLSKEQININLSDFFFVEDGIYPSEFELVLVICKDGTLSAGCASQDPYYKEDNPYGVIRQERSGVIFYNDIIAWKPIDGLRVL